MMSYFREVLLIKKAKVMSSKTSIRLEKSILSSALTLMERGHEMCCHRMEGTAKN